MITNILHNALLATNKNNKFDWYTPLTFTAQEPNSTITLYGIGEPVIDGLQYRTDINSDWLTYTIGNTTGDTITLDNVGDYVQFQNTKEQLSIRPYNNFVKFVMTGKIAASGNIQSMLNYSHSCPARCYVGMFNGCTSLTEAPDLPATTLAEDCYLEMFSGCSSLTTAPSILPATNLAETCYWCMFEDCTSLTVAPELPATTLAENCYVGMFSGCSSLTTAPELPATNLAHGCYSHMFNGCTSLTVAPKLPATNLADNCYGSMFGNCTNLNYVKVGFTDWNSIKSPTFGWLNNVSPTGTFVCPEDLPIERGYSYIPEGWTVELIESNV